MTGPRTEAFRDRLLGLLGQVALLGARREALGDIVAMADEVRHRLKTEPMRIAVVGQIKKGKSTLVNGLLEERQLPTGRFELSYNVTELHWAPAPSIRLHFRDGRPPERRAIEELERFTARDDERLEELRQITKVEVGLPNELLRSFRLIDTPGLNSVYEHDEQNTLRLLGRSEEQVEQSSRASLGEADAIVFLFSRTLAASSQALLDDLNGPVGNEATPMRALGVLSRCDEYWLGSIDPACDTPPADPLLVGSEICSRVMKNPVVSKLFYTLVPVCGLLAVGAASLTDDDFTILAVLAAADPIDLLSELADVGIFTTAKQSLGLETEQRLALIMKFGAYGIWVACERIREGGRQEDLKAALMRASGVPRLRTLLLSHFGNRSSVIQADSVLRALELMIRRLREQNPPPETDQIAALVQRFRSDELAFRQVEVLGAHYRGDLTLTDEELTEMLNITGERGMTAPDRLGVPGSTSLAALESAARRRAQLWRDRTTAPLGGPPRRRASRMFTLSYENLADDISWAREFLGVDSVTPSGEPAEPKQLIGTENASV